jgi:hypothetical protein
MSVWALATVGARLAEEERYVRHASSLGIPVLIVNQGVAERGPRSCEMLLLEYAG